MNDNPFEIKEEACASSPDHRRYLLIQAVDTETGEIVWAVGDDQICAVTRADFIRTPEIRYNDVLIQEFPYKENTPESVGRWRPLIEELVKLTLAKYRTLDGLARAYVLECKHYYGKQTQDFTLLDPMSGSGTSQAAAQSLGVRSLLYDLNPAPACGIGGWDALRDEVDDSADLIFLHPPYHNLIPYSGNMWGTPHKDDLSRCSSYPEFVEKLNYIVQKLFMALRRDGRLAILVGDIRTKGSFYEDDGSLSKEELRQLRRIHAAAARFQAELQREMEKRHVPTAKRLSAGCRSQKDGEYDALI